MSQAAETSVVSAAELQRRLADEDVVVLDVRWDLGAPDEAALLEHPGVAEVAVTGEPDADLGQRIVARVVPSGDPRPPADELGEHVVGLLSPHKRPREIRFLESLPRSAVGKVQKHRLDN